MFLKLVGLINEALFWEVDFLCTCKISLCVVFNFLKSICDLFVSFVISLFKIVMASVS
jgi:hypothetical protein